MVRLIMLVALRVCLAIVISLITRRITIYNEIQEDMSVVLWAQWAMAQHRQIALPVQSVVIMAHDHVV